jgi:hypothetical protein
MVEWRYSSALLTSAEDVVKWLDAVADRKTSAHECNNNNVLLHQKLWLRQIK